MPGSLLESTGGSVLESAEVDAERSGPGALGKRHQAPPDAGLDGLGLAEMNHGRGQQAHAGVAMLLVVPLEKPLAKCAAVLDAAEAMRKLRHPGRASLPVAAVQPHTSVGPQVRSVHTWGSA